jgi:hypothetical protein
MLVEDGAYDIDRGAGVASGGAGGHPAEVDQFKDLGGLPGEGVGAGEVQAAEQGGRRALLGGGGGVIAAKTAAPSGQHWTRTVTPRPRNVQLDTQWTSPVGIGHLQREPTWPG